MTRSRLKHAHTHTCGKVTIKIYLSTHKQIHTCTHAHTDMSQEITTITNRDMQTSNDRIKIRITTTATTMDKEVGITHREVGIVIGTMDMII